MSLSEWLAIGEAAITLVSILASIITFIQKKNKDAVLDIMSKIPGLVSEAEKTFTGQKQGTAKLSWVLSKLEIECLKAHVKLSKEELTDAIESTLETPQKK